jgi:hypothetical protein
VRRTLCALALVVSVLFGACASDPCGISAWDRFVASLDGAPAPTCSEPEPLTSPDENPSSLGGSAGLCAPATGDSACLSCVKASCCAETVACTGESACACHLTCRAGGTTTASCAASCGAALDAVYTAATNCTSAHCAAQCPRLQ